jgi:hopanoid-associated phosphorylase
MLGILCGLEQEAVLARQINGAVVACAAARPQKARWLARELVRNGVTHLMSFGIAGGLEPGLPIGSLIVGTLVASVDGSWSCDTAWANELSRQLPEAHCGGVWGSEFLVPTAKDKRALYEKSHCLIVDMESQCAAQIAAEAKIPLAVVRAICDTSSMDVPPVVMASIAESGKIDGKKALWHLLRHPWQIPDLFHVGKGTGKALKVLDGSLRFLGTAASSARSAA